MSRSTRGRVPVPEPRPPGLRAAAIVAVWVLCTAPPHGAAAAPAVDVAEDPALEARVQRLSAELRCLVCQNQSLADSHADLALDLKAQVREQLRAGRGDDEVVQYMTDRYGDFILYRPPLRPTTLVLWAGPALMLLAACALGWRYLRRQHLSGLEDSAEGEG